MKNTIAGILLAFVVVMAPMLGSGILLAKPEPNSAKTQQPHQWTQWRGPSRDGKAYAKDAAWPDSLSETTLVEKWRVPFAPSYSGPIVTGDRVFTTETRDGKQEVTFALDSKTGEKIWQQSWDGAMQVPIFAIANGNWIRATPAYDPQTDRLYIAGMRDVLVCLDATTSQEHWRVDFVSKYGTPLPAFGFASSPLVDGAYVYVQAAESFIKLDKLTGEVLWRSAIDPGAMNSAFSSPVIATLAGQRQLVVQMRKELLGINIADGEVLWSQKIQAFQGMNILTPTVWGDAYLFTSAHSGRSQLWKVSVENGSYTINEQWQSKAQAYMSSPVVVNDHLYLHLKNRRFTCLDLATGEEKWRTKPFGRYWSLVAHRDKLLALDETGDLRLIRANPERFELLDERHLTDASSWAHLAVVGDEIYVRALDELVVYRWR
ncbi:PQQ-binding-like beta-propeller repeat protein [Adhaeretor mobilis]|uniref:Polyvinylalcohol dehydrogenase n=1 Tax=Adhaeretor mobilis TaxID=1930276 RepID=A0A517N3A4_9BACT|nr:PQQ-binding-like beta-propeller repeat protein [Adhaeretor mobilis]QDT01619.1 Polyvinylalcohol dehydrogenase precursor [Adhaeretor mobilis]